MSKEFTAEDLQRLGLDNCAVVSSVTVPWPIEEVSDGLPAELIIAGILSARVAGAHFLLLRAPNLAPTGVKIELALNDPGLYRLALPEGSALDPGGAVETESDSRVRGSVCFYAHADETVVCRTREGQFVLVRRGIANDLDIGVAEAFLHVDSLAEIAAPAWLPEETDPWLRETAERLADHGSNWQNGVAVGLLARLRDLDSTQSPGVQFQQLMRGNGPGTFNKARQWASDLSPSERETLKDLGLAEIDALYALVEDLAETYDPDSADWQQDFLALCHRRDDLECVRLLLHICGAAEPLEICLEGLDESARELMFALPDQPTVRDERLRRVARLDALAWWAQSAAA